MKIKTCTLLLSIALSTTTLSAAAETLQVEQLWQSEPQLLQPESVAYDILRHSLYVSNINGDPGTLDGNGFISLLDKDGTISKLKWVEGLNAPKGLAMLGKKLFVADVNQLVVIDVETAEIVQRFNADEDSFMNDIAIDSEGIIYVTDTQKNRIYRLYHGTLEVWLEDDRLENPNGIHIDNAYAYIASWGKPTEGWNTEVPGHLLKISLSDKTLSDYAGPASIGNLDGIAKHDAHSLVVSDWMQGKLLQVDTSGKVSTLAEPGQGSADLVYLRNKQMIYMPLMMHGTVIAYRVHH